MPRPHPLLLSLLGLPLACDGEPAATPAATPAVVPAVEAPPSATPPVAACTEGATRCEGTYTGTVKPGNNPPAGTQVMACTGGSWSVQEACDVAQSFGCYRLDDPATGQDVARCLSAFSEGE